MPRKKVASKTVEKPEEVTALTFYECQGLINEISALAAENDGELTDEQLDTLVAAQTQSIERLGAMCNFVKLMESKIQICKDRKKEINEAQQNANRTIDRIKRRVASWVAEQGKSYHVGEYELKSRKSTSVELVDGFDHPMFCSVEMVRKVSPDKARIKEALLAGEEVPGATLVESQNLTIK